MLVQINSAAFLGLKVMPVTIEVSITAGVGVFLVGLPDSAVKESLLRVTTALSACGYRMPGRRIVINLAPADLRKEGTLFDCAIALGILAASGQIQLSGAAHFCVWGELGLDGSLRRIPGALPLAIYAKQAGFEACFFPASVEEEASLIGGIRVCGATHLKELIGWLQVGEYPVRHRELVRESVLSTQQGDDFQWVVGQAFAKRGLEIAAAGAHNLLLVGPPGAGKSFMARCLASILPPMNPTEVLETTKIYSVAGLDAQLFLQGKRPFRSPHHTASAVSMTGGGMKATPGEMSLAHNGVLYLDEMIQFSPALLNELRQPLEERTISIARARYKVTYPASFMLVASMNPCPCGYHGDGTDRCTCQEGSIQRYWSRLSGPLLDRIDLQIFVRAVDSRLLVNRALEESSASIAARVAQARERQHRRFAHEGIHTNSEMNSQQLARYCPLTTEGCAFLDKIISRFHLSARAYSRILKLSRTLADLEGLEEVLPRHLSEAVGYRCKDVF
ncbi:MAG: YifB family Mg chelatase-like AAA ATPase [Bacteroidales bacterium]|nr:YifB family Mg chelatase-like AAA ATPase [Bacteroidales bacterium]